MKQVNIRSTCRHHIQQSPIREQILGPDKAHIVNQPIEDELLLIVWDQVWYAMEKVRTEAHRRIL